MGVESAFSSTDPVVIEWWQESEKVIDEWRAKCKEFDDEHPDHSLMWSYFGALDGHVASLKGKESPGVGWRQNKRTGEWVPHKGTKEGKRHAERFAALRYNLPQIPGMPDMADHRGKWRHVGMGEINGEVWATWSCPAEAVRKGGWSKTDLDETIWTEQPLSAYYLAKESATVNVDG